MPDDEKNDVGCIAWDKNDSFPPVDRSLLSGKHNPAYNKDKKNVENIRIHDIPYTDIGVLLQSGDNRGVQFGQRRSKRDNCQSDDAAAAPQTVCFHTYQMSSVIFQS
jgi:hypothetical protein